MSAIENNGRRRLMVVGVGGVDALVTAHGSHNGDLSSLAGEKIRVDFDDLPQIKTKFNLSVTSEHPGQTGANIALGAAKAGERVVFHTPFPEDDEHQELVESHLIAGGVDLQKTPYQGRIAYSYVLPVWDGRSWDRTIWAAKPTTSSSIEDFATKDVDGMVVAAVGGKSEETIHNAVEHALKLGLPLYVVGSDSQLKQFPDNPDLQKKYLTMLEHADTFNANEGEIRRVVIASGQVPSDNPYALVEQARNIGENLIVTMTRGADSTIGMDRERNIHEVSGPLRNDGHTLGVGDSEAVNVVAGIRDHGATPEGVGKSMLRGRRAGFANLNNPDATSAQPTKADLAEPDPRFSHKMITPGERLKRPTYIS